MNREENIDDVKETYNINNDQYRLFIGEGPQRGPYKNSQDIFGNNLWHYWGNSDSAIKLYEKWKNRLNKVNIYEKNKNGLCLFQKLIVSNKIELLDFLLKEYSLPENYVLTKNNENMLHLSVWANNLDYLIKYLKENKYQVNLQNNHGITPLIIAIHKNNIEMINTLLLAGADPNIIDLKGKNAMHHAADNGNIDIYEFLEDAGGDIEKKDILKRTPLQVFERYIDKTENEILHAKNYWLNQYDNLCKLWS